MKIKSISLEAFRVYEKYTNFDFTTLENKTASLVVIYGPNGFGKTSFTDAIEWGFTGSMSRISGNDKLVNTLDNDKKNASEQIYILKNRNSKLKQGIMKIVVDSNEEVIIKTRKLDGRMKTDYDPDNTNNKNRDILGNLKILDNITPEEFRINNIITSDSINSFLQFDNPEKRYETLIKFWDKDGDSKLYENINILYEELVKKNERVTSDIEGKTLKMKEILKNNLDYTTVNNIITKFNNTSDLKLQSIEENSNLNNFEKFKKAVISIKQKLESKELGLKTRKEGCTNLIGNYNSYTKKLEENLEIESNKERNNKVILGFRRIDAFNDDIKKNEEKIENEKSNKNKFDTLLVHKKEFETIIKNKMILETKNKNLLNLKNTLLSESKQNTTTFNKESQKLKDYILSNDKINTFYCTFNEKLKLYHLNEKRINYINKIKVESNMRLNRYKEKISIYGKQNKELKAFLIIDVDDLIRIDLQRTPSDICIKYIFEDIKNVHKQFIIKKQELEALVGEKSIIEKVYKKNERILELGLAIINENKSLYCPLCRSKFDNAGLLVDSIKSNMYFKIDFEQKINEIKQMNSILTKILTKIKDLIQHLKTNIGIKLNANDLVLLNLNTNKQNVEDNLKILSIKLNKFNLEQSQMGEFLLDLEVFLQKKIVKNSMNNILSEMADKIDSINNQIKCQDILVKQYETQVEENRKSITALDNDIELISNQLKLKENEYIYKFILSILKELNIIFNISTVVNEIVDLNYKIHLLNKKKIKLMSEINSIKVFLKDQDKDSRIQNNFHLDNKSKDNIQIISSYKAMFLTVVDSDNKKISIKLVTDLDKNIVDELHIIDNNKKYINEIFIYFGLFDLNSAKVLLMNDINTLTKSKEKLTIKLSKIENLKGKVESYLAEKIQKAFNLETINFIYKRIDPHPEFNEIRFVPDFNKSKPKMYIHAVNEGNELSPELYFSAAQVSILSLSIFLAKSLLENNDLDTIIMDDPVQHLDSINVLSFIDLIRSIITNPNINKQVIITTNNDAFFKLLKLKLDEDYYDSKFIELMSYGII